MPMRTAGLSLLLIATTAWAVVPDDNPPWVRIEVAQRMSAQTGRPIVFFVATDLAPGATTLVASLDRVFGARSIRPRWNEFHWVKVADLKSMDRVLANAVNEVIVTDPDLNELYRGVITSVPTAEAALDAALKKYAPYPIPYKTYSPATFKAASGKPLILVFADDGKNSQAVLTAFEQPMLAKYTAKCDFARFDVKRDAEAVKQWKVVSAPTIIVLDTTKEEGYGALAERTSGKKTPPELKTLLLRALKAYEKAQDR